MSAPQQDPARVTCHRCSKTLALTAYDDLPNGERNPFCRVCVAKRVRKTLERYPLTRTPNQVLRAKRSWWVKS